MLARRLLVFGHGDLRQPAEIVRSLAWDPVLADDFPCAIELSRGHGVSIGLAWLAGCGTRAIEQFERVGRWISAVPWVAIVDPDLMQHPGLVKLVAECCTDYHTDPVDPARLACTLGHVWGWARLRQQWLGERVAGAGKYQLIGESAAMQQLYRTIAKIEKTEVPVLIRGESGTGKELVARAIHRLSSRADKPFVTVNCGGIPASLIQTEMFGHEKGAFTGAHQRKIGHIEAAQGGTIFLDEIGDLPLEQQVSLLRFLQEQTIERVGSTRTLQLDVRVISATHVNLEQAIEQGKFRLDLYYRINVLQVDVPPLRERNGDIEMLARNFAERFARQNGREAKDFTPQALRVLDNYAWPGNVRELMNRLQSAVLLSERRSLTALDLGLEKRASSRTVTTLERARSKAEEEAIRSALRLSNNNLSVAARQLGVSRMTLYRLLDKYQCQN